MMAHIEIWYYCPVCNKVYDTWRKAERCRNKHPVRVERWAVGKDGKAVRIMEGHTPDSVHGVNYALKEAEKE